MKCSVIVAFYNNISALKLILAGLERQTYSDFEVIIADDGSREEIVSQINALIPQFSFQILHLWQPDRGWRKNKILNQAIEAAQTNYLVFIDGDCIPDDYFVQNHLKAREPGYALAGRRVNLSPIITQQINPDKVRQGFFRKQLLKLLLDKQVKQSERAVFVRWPWLSSQLDKHRKHELLGCNFSMFKNDFLKLNGFDERFVNPGVGEDVDVGRRLRLAGMDIKSVAYSALVYHLYHKPTQVPQATLDLQKLTLEENHAFTQYGIKQSLLNHKSAD